MDLGLPFFVYHPDPLATGSVVVSEKVYRVCEKARGYIYTGPVFTTHDLDESLCPWCIANGTAHEKFDASFTDEAGIGGYGDNKEVPTSILEIIAFRTPGFGGWQQEKWWTHCGDGAVFLGIVGYAELEAWGDKATQELIEEISGQTALVGNELTRYVLALSKDGSPTAYLFQCRHCGRYGGYSDCD